MQAITENHPHVWQANFPWPQRDQHKYDRGCGVVVAGAEMTGAPRLAAAAMQRVGAGLVTLLAPQDVWPIIAASERSIMVKPYQTLAQYHEAIAPSHINAAVIGCGLMPTKATRSLVSGWLAQQRATVLDAGALTAFGNHAETLFQSINSPAILTPHSGEFTRLFGQYDNKQTATREAAKRSGAIVVHKGADTIIAAPDGSIVLHPHGTPTLATGGTGDVLAGLCGGLLAQGMAAFDAACAACWLQAEAAKRIGYGLIAEDLVAVLPLVLNDLHASRAQ